MIRLESERKELTPEQKLARAVAAQTMMDLYKALLRDKKNGTDRLISRATRVQCTSALKAMFGEDYGLQICEAIRKKAKSGEKLHINVETK